MTEIGWSNLLGVTKPKLNCRTLLFEAWCMDQVFALLSDIVPPTQV